MNEEAIGRAIVECALTIHTALGPGLLESAYESCVEHELTKRALSVHKQVAMPVRYDSVVLPIGYRIDLLVESKVVVEVKCAERLHPLHRAQVLTYLKLGDYRLGFLLNFNTIHMRHGIRRIVNGL